MALLNILKYPDERLHTVAKPVAQIDERIQTLVADMLETMYASHGIGLAAALAGVLDPVLDDVAMLLSPIDVQWMNRKAPSLPSARSSCARAGRCGEIAGKSIRGGRRARPFREGQEIQGYAKSMSCISVMVNLPHGNRGCPPGFRRTPHRCPPLRLERGLPAGQPPERTRGSTQPRPPGSTGGFNPARNARIRPNAFS